MNDDPFDEGELAAMDGKPAESNPYPEGSDAHFDWSLGWGNIMLGEFWDTPGAQGEMTQ